MQSKSVIGRFNLSQHRNASITFDIKTAVLHRSGSEPRPETDQGLDSVAVDCSKTFSRTKGKGKRRNLIWHSALTVSPGPKFRQNGQAFRFREISKISDAAAAGRLSIYERQNMCRMMIITVKLVTV